MFHNFSNFDRSVVISYICIYISIKNENTLLYLDEVSMHQGCTPGRGDKKNCVENCNFKSLLLGSTQR